MKTSKLIKKTLGVRELHFQWALYVQTKPYHKEKSFEQYLRVYFIDCLTDKELNGMIGLLNKINSCRDSIKLIVNTLSNR